MTDRVYLDHAATTPLDPAVLEAMRPALLDSWGNASSLHREGGAARDLLESSRERVAAALGVEADELLFTSGGTESDNLALFGVARAARDARGASRLLVSAIEHHAVLHPAEELAREGFTLELLPVGPDGRVAPELTALDDVALVSVMAANNEVGSVQPIAALGAACQAAGVPLHTDAVQWIGRVLDETGQPARLGDLPIALASLSGHKLYGPKGVGALVVRRGVKLRPLLFGGSHEGERRPGTENVAGAVGLAEALERVMAEAAREVPRQAALRDRLREGVAARIPEVVFNTPAEGPRLPHILNVSFRHVEGEALLLALNARGVAVATGSACTSESLEPSHVLQALGRPVELAQGSLRFSLGRATTEADIERTLDALEQVVGGLRALSPLYG